MKDFKTMPLIPIVKELQNNRWLYLQRPSWDCDWYWGWGYLSNKNTHIHWDYLKTADGNYTERVSCLIDLDNKYYQANPKLTPIKWQLEELMSTFYTLKEAAGIYHIGGSHLITSPIKDILKSEERAKEINEIILPEIFTKFYELCNTVSNKEVVK